MKEVPIVDELERRAEQLALDVVDGRDGALAELGRVEDEIAEAERMGRRAERTARAVEARERERAEQRRRVELQRRLKPLQAAGAAFVEAAAVVERERGGDEMGLMERYSAFSIAAAGLGVGVPDLEPRIAPRLARLAGHRDRVNERLSRTPLTEIAGALVAAAVLKAGNTAGEVA